MKFTLFFLLAISTACGLKAQTYVPGEVLVKFQPKLDPTKALAESDNAALPIKLGRCVSHSWNIWVVKTAVGKEDAAISYLYHQPSVLVAQLDHYLKKRGVTPNDTYFPQQWNLLNSGQSGGTPGVDIDATDAWGLAIGGNTALGDTIVIAVVDGGADLAHEDLNFHKNNLEIPGNGIDDDHNGYIDDYKGWNAHSHDDTFDADSHGTHVCGIAGAIGDNGKGIAGVCLKVQIMPLELFDYTEAEIVEAYTYVYDQRRDYNLTNGAKGAFVVVTNSSFGTDYGKPSDYPLWCAMYDSLGKVGILSAAATADFNVDVDAAGDMPTTCPSDWLVTVTNVQRDGTRFPASGYGATSIDLAAPGKDIMSTFPNNTYGLLTGTSMSCPHVAGAIALMYAAGCSTFMQAYHDAPDSMAKVVKNYLLESVDSTADFVGITVSGGRLNAFKSIKRMLKDYCDSCITLQVNTQPTSCYGDKNGSATLSVSIGTAPYSIHWSTGDSAVTHLDTLNAGVYQVHVVDSTGCSKYQYFSITQPAALTDSFAVTGPSQANNDGVLTTTVQGGTPPYTFHWTGPRTDSTKDLTAIPVGTYYVTITDSSQCTIMDTVVVGYAGIEQVSEDLIQLYPNPSSGNVTLIIPANFSDATVEVTDLVGRTLSASKLTAGQHELPLSFLQKGIYLLRVTDSNKEAVKKIVRL